VGSFLEMVSHLFVAREIPGRFVPKSLSSRQDQRVVNEIAGQIVDETTAREMLSRSTECVLNVTRRVIERSTTRIITERKCIDDAGSGD
jgi:hypothetical protein